MTAGASSSPDRSSLRPVARRRPQKRRACAVTVPATACRRPGRPTVRLSRARMDCVLTQWLTPTPHSRAGHRSRSLPLGSLRRRLRNARLVRPRRQYQIPGFSSVLHFRPADRGGPRQLNSTTSRSTADGDCRPIVCVNRTHVRLPNLYGPQVGLFFAPTGPILISRRRANLGRGKPSRLSVCIYLVWNCCPNSAPTSRNGRSLRDRFSSAVSFLRARPDVRSRAGLLHLRISRIPRRSPLAGRHRARISHLQAAVPGCHPAGVAAVSSLETVHRTRRSPPPHSCISPESISAPPSMRAYFDTLWHMSRVIGARELSLAPIQMHSLRSFWTLLIPWPEVALALYALSSIARDCNGRDHLEISAPLALRFSALTLAAVLVNPHLFVYDLLVLAPALLAACGLGLTELRQHSLLACASRCLFVSRVRLAAVRPALALDSPPTLRAGLRASCCGYCGVSPVTPSHKLASNESTVV